MAVRLRPETPRAATVAAIACTLAIAIIACSRTQARSIHAGHEVREEPVTFHNADVTLAGTLYIPADGPRHPAVVLFHGSGPQGRIPFMGHWFAEHGVAALTYDKRGVGASSGDFRKVPFTDLAGDGLAAVALLKARGDIDSAQIGVWGLSQGGWLGPLAASRSHDVAFVIAVSGPGVSPAEQMIFYYGNELRDRGVADGDVDAAGEVRRKVWRLLSTGEGVVETQRALDDGRDQRWFSALDEQGNGLFRRSARDLANDTALRAQPWYRLEANYDPRNALRALSVPALFIFGDRDELVPVERSAAIIRETLEQSRRSEFSIVVFPGADHGIFVTPPAGGRTLAPGYLDLLEHWLRKTLH